MTKKVCEVRSPSTKTWIHALPLSQYLAATSSSDTNILVLFPPNATLRFAITNPTLIHMQALDLLHMSSVSVAPSRPLPDPSSSTSPNNVVDQDANVIHLSVSKTDLSVSATMAQHMRAWSSAVAASKGSGSADQMRSSSSSIGFSSDPNRVKRVGDSWKWPSVMTPETSGNGFGLATRGLPSHLHDMLETLESSHGTLEAHGLEDEGAEQTAMPPPLPTEWMAIVVGGDSGVIAALGECRGRGARTGVVVAGYHHPQPDTAGHEDTHQQLSRETRVELGLEGGPIFRYSAGLAVHGRNSPLQAERVSPDPQQDHDMYPGLRISVRGLDPVSWQVRDATEVILHWECVCEGAYDVARRVAWGSEAMRTVLSSAFPWPKVREPWTLGIQIVGAPMLEQMSAEYVRDCASHSWDSLQVVPCILGSMPTESSLGLRPVAAPTSPARMYMGLRARSKVKAVRQTEKHFESSPGHGVLERLPSAALSRNVQRVGRGGLGELQIEDMEREFEAYLRVILK